MLDATELPTADRAITILIARGRLAELIDPDRGNTGYVNAKLFDADEIVVHDLDVARLKGDEDGQLHDVIALAVRRAGIQWQGAPGIAETGDGHGRDRVHGVPPDAAIPVFRRRLGLPPCSPKRPPPAVRPAAQPDEVRHAGG